MALHLEHIPKWNALKISLNGKNPPGVTSKYYNFLDKVHEKIHPDQYSVLIPSNYLEAYLKEFEYITTMNQTVKSMLGTEEVIVPQVNYELKHLDKMKLPPYPFQEMGARFLMSEEKAVVGDEVGLGKTPQSLTAANELLQEEIVDKILLVMPASLKYQWLSEIEKFTIYSGIVVEGTKKQREKIYASFKDSTDEFMIIGYETARNDIDYLLALQFDCVILDEAHKISNRTSKTHKAIVQLQPKYRFALTGTPMQNKPEEIFGLMKWIDKDIFGGVTKFKKKHIITGEKYGKQWVDLGYRYLDDIREQVAPKMIRRLKKDVAPDLPDIIHTTIRVDMNKPQIELFEAIKEDIGFLQEELKEFYQNQTEEDSRAGKKHPKEDAMLGYLYMMQALSNHPLLLAQGNSKMSKKYMPLVRQCKTSPKLEALIEQIANFLEQGSKIVIFSQYVRMLKFIEQKIQHHFNQDPYMIYGDISSKARHEQMIDFENNPMRNIMLLSDAGNAGLNIGFSDILINYDSPWSISKKIQREGRIHRINSTFDKVTIMNMVTNDTIDEVVLNTLERKMQLNDSLVESTAEEVNIMQGLMKDLIDKE